MIVPPAQSRRLVVIVVEDDELLREMAVDHLAGAGFEVLEAGDAHEAIAIMELEASRLHVVFSDVNMPGRIDGVELAHHVRRTWPWIGFLVTSGRAEWEMRKLPQGCRYLAKPYHLEAAARHLRELGSENSGS